ncbi:hypothetical protein [Marivita sp. GX14005]|uniref:hypothetical protein n=1 Tax=Marivita sp. GX14005 TaxID=2942276 RepID=UPI0020187728|nr:hypothetical protein [Marivita sp. GX14005]MCL3881003.1 hypothetical protein [Marivita sp. GX14005]
MSRRRIFRSTARRDVDFPAVLPDVQANSTNQSDRGSFLMTRTLLLILCLGMLTACDSGGGDVLQTPDEEESENGGQNGNQGENPGSDGDPIDSDGRLPALPPGTTSPDPNAGIVRVEPRDDETGGGFATDIQYRNDQGQDEFYVDNIAFDGDNVYTRGDPVTGVAQLGPYGVYEGKEQATDPVTGTTLDTFTYRALYGRSTTGQTEFAIVRSGSYIDYGFGGFVYQRNDVDDAGNPVRLVLPDEGDARYLGDYAGIRIFEGRSGLEYVQGDAEMFVDFKDFNNGNRGVALYVRNRQIFDSTGKNVTPEYLASFETDSDGGTSSPGIAAEVNDRGELVLPPLRPVISPNIADSNGEIAGELREVGTFEDGATSVTAEGNYYAIVSGEDAGEIVGVLVIEGDDPRTDNTSFQETGGFIIYRQ